jgi:hypothetical protein
MSSLSKKFLGSNANPEPNSATTDLIEQVRVKQEKPTTALRPRYDFIVCGSGSSGFARTIKSQQRRLYGRYNRKGATRI